MFTAAQNRALSELLALEGGGMTPLRAVAGGNGVYASLHAQKLIEPDATNGRYKLTAAGRAQVQAAQSNERNGVTGPASLRGVRG